MKNHLKSLDAPRSWILPRIRRRFTLRPRSSGHPYEFGLPLGLILRDKLHVAQTAAEVRKLLSSQQVLVDGRRRTDLRLLVGLFDVLTIPLLQKSYRIVLDTKGRLVVKEVPAAESTWKPCKVTGKTSISGGKVQAHLHDGKNLIVSKKVAVGDTLVLELPSLKIKDHLPLQPGVAIFLTKGKHSGSTGRLQRLTPREAVYMVDGREIETSRSYVFVLGEKIPSITL